MTSKDIDGDGLLSEVEAKIVVINGQLLQFFELDLN
jgi:hypothetical protein